MAIYLLIRQMAGYEEKIIKSFRGVERTNKTGYGTWIYFYPHLKTGLTRKVGFLCRRPIVPYLREAEARFIFTSL